MSKKEIPVCQSLRDAIMTGLLTNTKGLLYHHNLGEALQLATAVASCQGSKCSNWSIRNHLREGRCRKHREGITSPGVWNDPAWYQSEGEVIEDISPKQENTE